MISTNEGITWHASLTGSFGYLNAAVAQGQRGIFVATSSEGIIRSLDFGSSWVSINGPSTGWDSRNITAINDNLLIVIDEAGSIWRTTNSGGSWVTASRSPTSYSFEPASLFAFDTVLTCDEPLIRSAAFTTSACDELSVSSQTITGLDKDAFQIVGPLPAYMTGLDSIRISFHPKQPIDYSATYTAVIGGRTVTLDLLGHGADHRFTNVSPSLDFGSVLSCTDTKIDALALKTKACNTWKVIGLKIEGPDSIHFVSLDTYPRDVTGLDSLHIGFSANSSRSYSSTAVLELEGGRIERIPLTATGIKPAMQLSVGAAPKQTLFVGDDMDVPISINSNSSVPPFSIFLRYDTAVLVYAGAGSGSGQAVSTDPNASPGHVQVRFSGANAGASDAYVRFRIFPTHQSCGTVSIDSIVFDNNSKLSCPEVLSSGGPVELCGPAGCGEPIISSFMRYGTTTPLMVESIVPNPTRNTICITLQKLDGLPVSFVLHDLLGGEQLRQESAEDRLTLDLSGVPNGNYYLRVSGGGVVRTERVVIRR